MFVPNTRYQVKTPSGWMEFSGIKMSVRSDTITLTTNSETEITTTPEHKIKLLDGNFENVSNLIGGEELASGDKVVSVCAKEKANTDVFDLINVSGGHEYFTNGIISKNCAWISNFDDIWTGLSPTISTGGQAIILSTPNGATGQYYNLWVEAEAGVNGFNPIRLPWQVHPEHDQAWFDHETRSLSKKKIAQEFLCVAEDTKIVTPTGYELVKNLRPGDLVLTHKGRFRRVNSVTSRLVKESEKLFEVSSPGNRKDKFIVTGNHPMLSYRLWANNDSSFDVLRDNLVEPTWIEAQVIATKRKTTDRILSALFPLFQHTNVTCDVTNIDVSTLHESVEILPNVCRYSKQRGYTNRFVSVNYDLGRLIGLYLAEGSSSKDGLNLGFHLDEFDTHAKWCKDTLQSLGCLTDLQPDKVAKTCRVWTFNKYVGKLMRKFVLGGTAPDKVLDMDLVLSCGIDFIRGVLIGHYQGDGNHYHNTKFCVYSSSPKLIYQLRILNSLFNLYPRVGKTEKSKSNLKHHDMWYLEFQAENSTYEQLLQSGQQYKKQSRTRLKDSYFVGRHTLVDVTSEYNNGEFVVYDVSVEEDRSFVAHSAILHNCDFISSGDTFLQPDELSYIRSMVIQPPFREGNERNIWVWKHPIVGRSYIISADISRGDAHDYSAFHVIDSDECEVVAEYMGKLPPEKMADLLLEWGKKYNNAFLIPENNIFGYFVCAKLRDVGYPRLYYHDKTDPFNYIATNPVEVPGFPTSQKSRVQILTKLEELIRSKVLKVYSQRLYDQLQAFIWKGSKPMAAGSNFDDLVMSLAIGCWLVEGGAGNSENAAAWMNAMLKSTGVSTRDVSTTMADITNMKPLVNPQIMGYGFQDKHRKAAAATAGQKYDFSWLFR